MKILFVVIAIVVVIVGIAGWSFWQQMQAPLYRPGMVRAGKNLTAPLTPAAQSVEAEGEWEVEPGIRLHYFTQGQGRNVLVIHGGPGMPFTAPLAGLKPFEDRYRFVYYDQRGCGESTRPIDRFDSKNVYQNMLALDKSLGLGAQIADIERIRQILGEDKLILIGHSWGGFLASLYAAEFPEHVQDLILVSPATSLVMPQPKGIEDLFATVRTRLPEDQLAGYDALMKEYLNFNALFQKSDQDLVGLGNRFGDYYRVASAHPMPEQGKPGGWMVWAMYVSLGQRHDYRPALETVQAPVLVLHGDQDLQSKAASHMYAETFPNARFVVIPNAGHNSFLDQPDQFAAAVQDLLR
jgi:proline iminopeptidase